MHGLTARLTTPAIGIGVAGTAILVGRLLSGEGQLTAFLGLVLAATPLLVIGILALSTSSRAWVLGAALGLSMTANAFNGAVPFGAAMVFLADVIVFVAVVAWVLDAARAASGEAARASTFRSAVVKWPLVIFAFVMLVNTIRGHEAYGASLLGQPVRLVYYAGIVGAMTKVSSQQVYRVLVGVFYSGAVWQFVVACYHLATGTSQTESFVLSTGGTRVVAITVSFFLLAALVLALLNLAHDLMPGRRLLHLTVAILSFAGIVLAFARGTSIALAVVVTVLAVTYRGVRRALVWLVPAAVPLAAAAAAFAPNYTEKVVPTLEMRLRGQLSADASVQWRVQANRAILKQFKEEPIFGVGFGAGGQFSWNGQWVVITQDPHDDYVYLLAGSGIVGLASFALLLIAFLWDIWRRRHVRAPHERLILVWAAATLFTILLNAAAEPLLTSPSILLAVWALLLLPGTIPIPRGDSASPSAE